MSDPTFEDAITMVREKAELIRKANMTRRGRQSERAEEAAWFFDNLADKMTDRLKASRTIPVEGATDAA